MTTSDALLQQMLAAQLLPTDYEVADACTRLALSYAHSVSERANQLEAELEHIAHFGCPHCKHAEGRREQAEEALRVERESTKALVENKDTLIDYWKFHFERAKEEAVQEVRSWASAAVDEQAERAQKAEAELAELRLANSALLAKTSQPWDGPLLAEVTELRAALGMLLADIDALDSNRHAHDPKVVQLARDCLKRSDQTTLAAVVEATRNLNRNLTVEAVPIEPGPCLHLNVPTPEFDSARAATMTSSEVRRVFPRGDSFCPDCKTNVLMYASNEHFLMGDW